MLHESNQKQREMHNVPCFVKHASQAFDFHGFKPFYSFLKDFEIFDPFNFFPVTRFSVTSLLVTRYFVTLFSNTREHVLL